MAQSWNDSKCESLTLFGGDEGWDAVVWNRVDDSVRGGNSESYLDCDEGTARFHGNLDLEVLKTAGFASQQTTGEWDLSEYAGIQLEISKGDKKRYTFIVKDDSPPPAETNVSTDKATLSWECDFELPPQDTPDDTYDKTVYIPFEAFNPTYRGKLQKDVDPLDTTKIRRFSIMMRSFFGSQEGEFSLSIDSIKALCKAPSPDEDATIRNVNAKAQDLRQLEAGSVAAERDSNYYSFEGRSWLLPGNCKIHRTSAKALTAFFVTYLAYRYFCG